MKRPAPHKPLAVCADCGKLDLEERMIQCEHCGELFCSLDICGLSGKLVHRGCHDPKECESLAREARDPGAAYGVSDRDFWRELK